MVTKIYLRNVFLLTNDILPSIIVAINIRWELHNFSWSHLWYLSKISKGRIYIEYPYADFQLLWTRCSYKLIGKYEMQCMVNIISVMTTCTFSLVNQKKYDCDIKNKFQEESNWDIILQVIVNIMLYLH